MRQLRSILVTGGAGFVGSALVRRLLKEPDVERVIALDKLSAPDRRGNLAGPDQDPRFSLVEGDLSDRTLLERLLSDFKVNGVFNLASVTTPHDSGPHAGVLATTNYYLTVQLVEACRPHAVSIVHGSSADVYGSVETGKPTENSALNPASPRTVAIAAADLHCLSCAKTYGLDLVTCRGTRLYGLRQSREAFLPGLIDHALHDRAIPLAGDGLHVRDWLHVEDYCEGLIRAFLRGAPGQVYNFAAGCERTHLGMARSVLRALGKPESLIASTPDYPGHERRISADASLALNFFGWQPTRKMADGLADLVRAMASNMAAA